MQHSQSGLMTIYRNQGKWDASNVEMADGQILCYDKKKRTPNMEFIDYGLGLFRPEVFTPLPIGRSIDLAEIYQFLIKKRQLLAYEARERFYEIGSFEGLRELDELLTNNPNQFLYKD
jgi:NDP-sugar pyrophosphorylase family protein